MDISDDHLLKIMKSSIVVPNVLDRLITNHREAVQSVVQRPPTQIIKMHTVTYKEHYYVPLYYEFIIKAKK